MSLSDPISDMLTRIRNGQTARLEYVTLMHSQICESVLKVLYEEGYIESYEVIEVRKNIKELKAKVKYYQNKGAIKEIVRVSKPGLRVYYSLEDLNSKKYFNGLGIYILSTSKGVMSDMQAKAANIGGEVICKVY